MKYTWQMLQAMYLKFYNSNFPHQELVCNVL